MNPTDPRHPRCNTNKVLKALEEGLIHPDTLITACMNYMSESDVAEMAEQEGLLVDDYEEWDD